ncbi:MAG: hypothetical protein ACRELC_03090 [Gemmatimonadota bacterium]
MRSDRSADVRREGARLYRYLAGGTPDPYVLERYVAAHRARPDLFEPSGGLDRTLAYAASHRCLPLHALDASGRFLAPGSTLRRKLVLLTAIMECAPATCDRFELPDAGSRAAFFARAVLRGIGMVAALGLGLALLPPLHAARRLAER